MNNTINTLPVQAGERPLFHALKLLQTMYRDFKRNGNSHDTTTGKEMLGYIAQLQAIAYTLNKRDLRGAKDNSNDLYHQLTQLPLIFDLETTQKWENKKPWVQPQFCHYQPYITSYTQTLDSGQPSAAYQLGLPENDYIWQQWFKLTPTSELISTIEYSAQQLLKWEMNRPTRINEVSNMIFFAQSIGFSEEQSNIWALANLLGSVNNWDMVLKEDSDLNNLWRLWEVTLNLKPGSISQIYNKDSQWVEAGLIKPVKEGAKSWSDIWLSMNSYNLGFFAGNYNNASTLFSQFFHPMNWTNVPVEQFNYIVQTPMLINSLQKNIPIRILVHGVHGSGKKTFIHSVLSHANYQGFLLNRKDNKYEMSDLKVATKLLKNLPNSALVVDKAEEIFSKGYEAVDLLKRTHQSVQFWTTTELKGISPEILNQFDFFLEIPVIPLAQRVSWAENIFQDKDTAYKAAQVTKTPHEFIRLSEWCYASNDYSWKNVNNFMAAFSRASSLTKEAVTLLNPVDTTETIPALAGYSELENLMDELIHLFNHPHDYKKLGAKPPKGILLVGPPGTGKTHFARHLSKTVGIPMFAPETTLLANNPDLIAQVFLEAGRHSPCIIFLDEIDSLIADPRTPFGVDLPKQKIINAFLAQVDGINSSEGILIVGATHRARGIDKAATRSGRLSKMIHLGIPHHEARKEIWQAHLVGRLTGNILLDKLAHASRGFSGAEIAEIINQAAVLAAQKRQGQIEMNNFFQACDNVFWGTASSSIIPSIEERKRTAIHEAGHALVAWKNKHQVNRVTIRPHAGFLGAVNWNYEEGIYGSNLASLVQTIELMLGGICAEQTFYGHYSNGGAGDLKSCKDVVMDALLEYGFAQHGPMAASDPKMWSEAQKHRFEQEETHIMNTAFSNTLQWLTTHKDLLEEFSQFLLEHKEVSGILLDPWHQRVENADSFVVPQLRGHREVNVLHNEDSPAD